MKNYLIFIIVLGLNYSIYAQDPTFSQFNFNKIYLNPAFAGHDGGTSINLNNHSHLVRVPGDYRVTSATVDMQSPCHNFGIGFIGMQETEGLVPINRTTFGVSGAYVFDDIIKDKRGPVNDVDINFSLGMALRYVNISINTEEAVFSSQLDHINGIVSNTPNTPLDLVATDYLDNDIGGVAVLKFRNNQNLIISTSVSHLRITNPDESLQNRNVLRPTKYTVYIGHYMPIKVLKTNFAVSPQLLFNKQNQLESLTLGAYLFGNTSTTGSTGLYFGMFYQNTWYPSFEDANSLIFNIGVNDIQPEKSKMAFSFGYSIDIPNRGLNLGTSHEVSVRFHLPDYGLFCDGRGGRIYDCPKF